MLLLPVLFLAAATGALSATTPTPVGPSTGAAADIPADYLTLYQRAATECPGLDWTVLAAIGKIETNHGRSPLPGVHNAANAAGAQGVMQFLPDTFNYYTRNHPVPPGGATPPSPYDPVDAIYAAAWMLCANGAHNNQNLRGAIWSYNHATWYVDKVLTQAQNYATTATSPSNAPSAPAQKAIDFALTQLGQPYVWGGNGPPDGGFDCSGLTTAAYAAAGITLPRTADAQYRTGPLVPAGQPLLPGDLVFYGQPNGFIHHVGLYLGNGHMVNAPTFNKPVQISGYRWTGDDYAGATRPSK